MPITNGAMPAGRPVDWIAGVVEAFVGVGGCDGLEGGADPLRPQPLAEGPQGVDSAGKPSVAPEEDQAAPFVVAHHFVVDQRAAELGEPRQHRQVVALSFDHVGEEEVGGARQQALGRDLLDAHDEVGIRKVVRHHRACADVLLVVVDAPRRGLDDDLQSRHLDQLARELGCHHRPSLPGALGFSADADHAAHHSQVSASPHGRQD
jgi:hypothetical protein